MGSRFKPIEGEDSVLHINFQGQKKLFYYTSTFRMDNFLAKIKQAFSGVSEEELRSLFDEGVDCEILKPGASWQKGKIRLHLEFCSDALELSEIPADNALESSQPESPLADIRQMVTEGSYQDNS